MYSEGSISRHTTQAHQPHNHTTMKFKTGGKGEGKEREKAEDILHVT